MSERERWERFSEGLCRVPDVGLTLDVSRMGLTEAAATLKARVSAALDNMVELEAGAIANPDEGRRVGHYWLRAPSLAPEAGLAATIEETLKAIRAFASDVHDGTVSPQHAKRFDGVLVVGIGGSALGPQLVADALCGKRDKLSIAFLDNTDPDGIDRTLRQLGDRLARTLTVVISKSGGTKETRNGMLEVERAYHDRGLAFARHAVAITGEDSALDRVAVESGWLRRFPMWDWVGGRTSVTSAVGLLPAALQGFDPTALLEGARLMDEATRAKEPRGNPAALLAMAWHAATGGQAQRAMVVLPYKDRLALFARYLQQLVMESLGKEKDLAGKVVHQGLTVYGNKGSTDQHAYVQQLREGPDDFFVTFVQVLRDRERHSMEVEEGITAGDYLLGFLLGTREALTEAGRRSLTLTLDRVDERSVGALIALFERAVGLYAHMIGVNAYHQPGVEAGKKAAGRILELQASVTRALGEVDESRTALEWATAVDAPERAEEVFRILEHLAANPDRGVVREGADPREARFRRA